MNAARLFARVKHLEIHSTRLLESLLTGRYRSVFRGPGLEFAEVREYVETDDPRHIDWNVSSRFDAAYTKTFREERSMKLFLIVDLSASIFVGQGNQVLREELDLLFSVFAFAAIQNKDKVGACFFTDQIEAWVPPNRGRAHVLRLVQDLLTLQPRGRGSDLALALRTTGETLSGRGICVILSDFKTSGYWRDLANLARRHDVIAIRLVSGEDVDFPRAGTFYMHDAESNAVMPAFGASATFRRAYRDYWVSDRKQWVQEVRRQGASPMEISAGDDPLVKLFHFFDRRRRRRGWR